MTVHPTNNSISEAMKKIDIAYKKYNNTQYSEAYSNIENIDLAVTTEHAQKALNKEINNMNNVQLNLSMSEKILRNTQETLSKLQSQFSYLENNLLVNDKQVYQFNEALQNTIIQLAHNINTRSKDGYYIFGDRTSKKPIDIDAFFANNTDEYSSIQNKPIKYYITKDTNIEMINAQDPKIRQLFDRLRKTYFTIKEDTGSKGANMSRASMMETLHLLNEITSDTIPTYVQKIGIAQNIIKDVIDVKKAQTELMTDILLSENNKNHISNITEIATAQNQLDSSININQNMITNIKKTIDAMNSK